MRIISGLAKGTKLYTLEGLDTRPTLDRIKEPLFSILMPYIENAIVLDLFGGSGALGLESLSRGAKYAIFGENSIKASKIIEKNIEKTHMTMNARVIQKDFKQVLETVSKEKKQFDIIFLDPPYNSCYDLLAIDIILKEELLAKDGIIIVETDEKEKINCIKEVKNIEVQDIRKYGRVNLVFIKARKG